MGMIDDYETQLKETKRLNELKLKILEKRIENHIDELGNNILDKFPYLVKLLSPLVEYYKSGDYIIWLKQNIDEHDYSMEWPHLIYFKNAEDAMAFKLRWL